MRQLNKTYQLLLLSAIVLTVYYPSLTAEISLVDDLHAISVLSKVDQFSLVEIFFPRTSGGGYYRPFIGLSYWIDKNIWALDPGMMHLEVVTAHLINAILLFFIAHELLRSQTVEKDGYLPLAVGLLFALHPVVTESVNWISGRTDVMMGNFALISFFLVLKYKQNSKVSLLLFCLVSAFLALCAKEAAFGYLVAIPLFLFCKHCSSSNDGFTDSSGKYQVYLFLLCFAVASLAALFFGNYWLVLSVAGAYLAVSIKLDQEKKGIFSGTFIWLWGFLAALVLSVSVFYGIRKIAYSSDVDKISQTIRLMFADMNYTISLFLGAIGFYFKKYILPFPLNFFIVEIDPLYDFAGIAVLLFTLRQLVVRSMPSLLFLTGLCINLPALPFAFGTIAWTGYAERYIYLPSAFWLLALVLWFSSVLDNCDDQVKKMAKYAIVFIIAIAAAVTFSRNIIWQTNVALLRDTVNQSPNVRMLRDLYVAALIDAGDMLEAKRQYAIAKTLPVSFYKNRYDDRVSLIMGGQFSKEGKHAEALQIYLEALVKVKYGSAELILAAMHEVDFMLNHAEYKSNKQSLFELKKELSQRMTSLQPRVQ